MRSLQHAVSVFGSACYGRSNKILAPEAIILKERERV